MPSSESILRFLNLEADDFDFLQRYEDVLCRNLDDFAGDFYEYLFSHVETAAALQGLDEKSLARLTQQQASHFRRLVTDRFSSAHVENLLRAGQAHQNLGIAPAWIAGGYLLYWEHANALASSPGISPGDRLRMRQILAKIIFADMAVQLEGYAEGESEDHATRAALTRVLIETILAERSDGTWDSLLHTMCKGLTGGDTHILSAWSAVTDRETGALVLSCISGTGQRQSSFQLDRECEEACRQILSQGQPTVMSVGDARLPQCFRAQLPDKAQEIGIFPFGDPQREYSGIGIVAVDTVNYFKRIGFGHFMAFSHFGELLLNLRDQSLRDGLTALPNRVLFNDRLVHAISGITRRERLLAIGVLDLDGFKAINDTQGHATGDAVLQQIAARMRSVLRPQDTLARLGGDEFGLLVDGLENLDQLEAIANRLLAAIRQPIEFPESKANLSGSVGFTLFPMDESDSETLLRHADLAMYASKNAGRDRFTLYASAMTEHSKWHSRTTRELRLAVQREELLLHFQPQVDMGKGDIIGVEALLRWNHPERGLLMPADFIQILEDDSIASLVGRYVLEKSMAQADAWRRQGLPLRIAVNISSAHLLSATFIDDLRALLAHPRYAPDMLEIEVTETTAIADLAAAREVLTECRSLGISVALDDFGTGNAPLSYLQNLPADCVKIDRGFVSDILNNPKDAAIVAGVITSARLLGLEVIAEGVETPEHGCLLLQLGCRRAQGYAIARPLAADAMPGWVHAYRSNEAWVSWTDRPWRPEKYGLLMIALAHSQRAREIEVSLSDPRDPIPEYLVAPESEQVCVLGKWLEGEGQSRFCGHPQLHEIKQLHDRVHEAAREAAQLKAGAVIEDQPSLRLKLNEIIGLSNAIQDLFRNWVLSDQFDEA